MIIRFMTRMGMPHALQDPHELLILILIIEDLVHRLHAETALNSGFRRARSRGRIGRRRAAAPNGSFPRAIAVHARP